MDSVITHLGYCLEEIEAELGRWQDQEHPILEDLLATINSALDYAHAYRPPYVDLED